MFIESDKQNVHCLQKKLSIIISLHQQLLMWLLPLMMLWSSGDW